MLYEKKMQVFFFTVTFSPNTGQSKSSMKLKVNLLNLMGEKKMQNLVVELTATEP